MKNRAKARVRLDQERKEEQKRQREDLKRLRSNAPFIKALFRLRGSELRFCDLLDSYREEFDRISLEAKQRYPMLVGIHEVSDAFLAAKPHDWSIVGCGEFQHLPFKIEDEHAVAYADIANNAEANLNGEIGLFRDSQSQLRSVILIRKTGDATLNDDQQYALKVGALLHEIGHLHDIENCINFDPESRRLDVVKAAATPAGGSGLA